MIVTGSRHEVDAFLSTPRGARFAKQIARATFQDESALALFELGDGPPMHAAVEAELDRLIAARNRENA